MKILSQIILILTLLLNTTSCEEKTNAPPDVTTGPAVVNKVSVSGTEGNYTFSVTLRSPDTGCDQYADWWEVISVDGTSLKYRRILAHSHVGEQPFARSGGPVTINANTEVIVRGHMNSTGYGVGMITMKGSVANGFSVFDIPSDIGADLDKMVPQPNGCAF